MTLALVLFVLRIISALILIAFLGALFFVIWRDYESAAIEVEASRRIYGRLVSLHELDGSFVSTGEVYPLLPITSMGRAPTNTIRLQDKFASTDHALVSLRNGVWWLEDRQSRNGTSLNGMIIQQPVIVTDGDVINVGAHHFRLELEQ